MEKTHWLKSPNKNYLGSYDIPESGELILTIKSAGFEEVTNPKNRETESLKVVHFVEDVKPLICNQTNSERIILATGSQYMEDSVGSKICLITEKWKDRKTKELIDVVRIKIIKTTATELKALFESVESKIDKTQIEHIKRVIDNDEKTSFTKVEKYLKSL